VTHPTNVPGFDNFLRNELSTGTFSIQESTVELGGHLQGDPFYKLPYLVLDDIFRCLRGTDILSLIRVSASANMATRRGQFWKRLIKSDMPWLWELTPELLNEARKENLNYKGLYLWLEKSTRPVFGITGPFMGIANRRRIWNTCHDIYKVYSQKLGKKASIEYTEEANDIRERAEVIETRIVALPRPSGDISTHTKLFVYGWTEIQTLGSVFETYWDTNKSLVGLGVVFDDSRRVFGREGVITNTNLTRHSVRIPAGSWVTSSQLHIPKFDILANGDTRAVQGITVSDCINVVTPLIPH
jgi:hypothetical protein